MRKHDPCHQEAHSFLRRVKQTLLKQALDLKAGSSVENGECGKPTSDRSVNDGEQGLGSSPGEGKGYPLQDSGLENSKDHIVHGVAKSWT